MLRSILNTKIDVYVEGRTTHNLLKVQQHEAVRSITNARSRAPRPRVHMSTLKEVFSCALAVAVAVALNPQDEAALKERIAKCQEQLQASPDNGDLRHEMAVLLTDMGTQHKLLGNLEVLQAMRAHAHATVAGAFGQPSLYRSLSPVRPSLPLQFLPPSLLFVVSCGSTRKKKNGTAGWACIPLVCSMWRGAGRYEGVLPLIYDACILPRCFCYPP